MEQVKQELLEIENQLQTYLDMEELPYNPYYKSNMIKSFQNKKNKKLLELKELERELYNKQQRYYLKNKDKINEKRRDNYQTNKESITASRMERYRANKEQECLKAKDRYYSKKQLARCEHCGKEVDSSYLSKHLQTKSCKSKQQD